MKRTGLMMAALALVMGTSACGGAGGAGPMPISPGPALVVERFLQAVNANELRNMMELFGTAEQSIAEIDGQSKAERRMYVLASLLRHDDYSILSQEGVPGRLTEAVQLNVQIRRSGRSTVVPHILVQKQGGGWIIEQIHVEELTR